MEIHNGLESLPVPGLRGSIATWGVFDGVHRGHRKILQSLIAWARERNAASLVITFDRHPAEVLRGEDVPLVTTLAQRLRLMEGCGVGHVLLLPFTREFAGTAAEAFIRDIVAKRIGVSGVLLGHDSQFGSGRAGGIGTLRDFGKKLGLEVRDTEPELHRGRPVSSSRIREAIREGRLEEAENLLGRPAAITGTVVRGDGRGASLGFPTANLEPHHRTLPPHGVYAVQAEVEGRTLDGVANLGTRPTFHGEGGAPLLEVHLLAPPDGDLNGREMEVRFLFRVRDEKKFSGPEELKRQISDDISSVRAKIGAQRRRS